MTKPTTLAQAALPIRTMNDEPMQYPLAGPATLSDDARLVYRRAGSTLDRDLFDPKSHLPYISQADRNKFRPTQRMLAAIAELELAGLARYTPQSKSLSVTKAHDAYTIARGRGSQIIRVRTFDQHPDESQLLAVLIGADIESRDPSRGLSELTLRARHEDATDFEHDASSTAQLVLRNPSPITFAGYGLIRFTAVLTEARLYSLGIDPLTVSDRDTQSGENCDTCTVPHPFAPYMPPALQGLAALTFVEVEARPFKPYLVLDPDDLGLNLTPTSERKTT